MRFETACEIAVRKPQLRKQRHKSGDGAGRLRNANAVAISGCRLVAEIVGYESLAGALV